MLASPLDSPDANLAEGRDVLSILHAHRERWDGKGYPHGLRGELKAQAGAQFDPRVVRAFVEER